MMASNPWINNMVSGYIHHQAERIYERTPGSLSRFFEYLFGGSLGDKMDRVCMKLVKRRNAKRYSKKLKDENYKQMFRSNEYTAKVHPLDHQGLVLHQFSRRLAHFNLESEMAHKNG